LMSWLSSSSVFISEKQKRIKKEVNFTVA